MQKKKRKNHIAEIILTKQGQALLFYKLRLSRLLTVYLFNEL